MGKLDGKVAVLTGATDGLAYASAKLFVKERAYVFVTGRNQEKLDRAVAGIGKNVTGIRADSAILSDLDKVFAKVKEIQGQLDILLANAGRGEPMTPIAAFTEEIFDPVFDPNVKGTLFTVKKALALMNDGSSIIMTGSIAGSKGVAGLVAYNASKAAIRSFARTMAAELKDRKIRANVLSPRPTDTAILENLPDAVRGQLVGMVPLARLGRPEELADAALFLASSDSSFVTGIDLFVDGGTAQI